MSAEEVRSALTRVLAAGPVLGARLRPLLLEEFRRATARDLEPVLRSFGKFSAFLADNADLVSVQADSRSGDIRVSLKSAGQPAHAPSRPRRRFSSQLWRAFTNPDERRRRFYHRERREVVHYLTGSPNNLDTSFANRVDSDDKFVEIEYAPAPEQTRWMQDFLNSTDSLPDSTRRIAEHFVGIAYDSSVNTAFESALASHGYEWRSFRASRVSRHIERWAEKNSISLELGGLGAVVDDSVPVVDSAETEARELDLRTGLQSLIGEMTTAELKQVLIPASVSIRIALERSRE